MVRRWAPISYRTGEGLESERLRADLSTELQGVALMADHEDGSQQPEGVTVDEPTEPALNPEDDDLDQPPVDGPSGEGRDGPGDTSQGTPGGKESPESAD